MEDERAAWEEQRRQAVAGHAAAFEAGRNAEAEQAAAVHSAAESSSGRDAVTGIR
jgi:hypothetical protein